MKYQDGQKKANNTLVILYARMWIEIFCRLAKYFLKQVILYARMWIEITDVPRSESVPDGHPLCEDVD